jgi:hypothetical protein
MRKGRLTSWQIEVLGGDRDELPNPDLPGNILPDPNFPATSFDNCVFRHALGKQHAGYCSEQSQAVGSSNDHKSFSSPTGNADYINMKFQLCYFRLFPETIPYYV